MFVAIGKPKRHVHKASHCGSKQQRSCASITLLLLVCATYIWTVALHAHSICGESHIQHNANGEVTTTSPPFHNEPHQSHVLFVKAAPSTTITSWSQHYFVAIGKSPSGKCAKLHTVAGSNNRDNVPQSIY